MRASYARDQGGTESTIPELLIIQSSGCASGVDYFRNFTKLKNLNF